LSVVPVNAPAGAVIEAVLTAVTSPFAFTVTIATSLASPKVPTLELTVARVRAPDETIVASPDIATSAARFDALPTRIWFCVREIDPGDTEGLAHAGKPETTVSTCPVDPIFRAHRLSDQL
jgi:hypothetical protein